MDAFPNLQIGCFVSLLLLLLLLLFVPLSLPLSLHVCVCVCVLPGYKSSTVTRAPPCRGAQVFVRERNRRNRRLHLPSPGCSVFSVYAVIMAKNLLKNPSGEEQLEFWELTENGGSQWKVEDMPGDCGFDFCNDGVTKYFATSFELCLKRQVIDLLAEDYSSDQLDAQPAVTVEDWYCGRTDCGFTYQMTVCLLDENQEVIHEFKPDPVTLDPDSDDCSWKQINHTFSDYGPGMRFITFEHGGQDAKFWDGWFGVRVTRSSVTVEV